MEPYIMTVNSKGWVHLPLSIAERMLKERTDGAVAMAFCNGRLICYSENRYEQLVQKTEEASKGVPRGIIFNRDYLINEVEGGLELATNSETMPTSIKRGKLVKDARRIKIPEVFNVKSCTVLIGDKGETFEILPI
jgi:hypothetical protein